MQETIRLEHLSIGYEHGKARRVVATGLTASIRCSQLTCLLGRNGVGKSTLLRTLAGFLTPLEGRILFQGQPITSFSKSQFARLVSVVLTGKPQVQNMRVDELIALGRSPYTDFWGRLRAADRQAVEEAMRLVGLEAFAHRMVSTLSDGERQKVMIAKALAQQTPIIILDEPTAFLDFPSKVETMQLLRRLARETDKTIFLSSHDLELTMQLADELWLMSDHQLVMGTPRQLASDGTLAHYVARHDVRFNAEEMTLVIEEMQQR